MAKTKTKKIKMKTNSSAKKRFSKTGGTAIKRGKAFRRHLMTRKNAKTNRQLRRATYFSAADLPGIKLLLPY